MAVNIEKTFYQIFTLSHKQPTVNFKIYNNLVAEIQDARYLGMYLDGKLNHAEKTVEKTKRY
jgi:hypothetical protein